MSTVDEIARQLQAWIQGAEGRAASKLPGQRELAERLGVSRASLREAVAMLESLGVLRSEPGRGVFIARPGDPRSGTAEERWRFQARYTLRDVYLVRNEIEELAVALATGAATRTGLARLRKTIDQMRAGATSGDLVAMAEADRAFHAGIVEIAGSPMLRDLAEHVGQVLEHSRQVAFADPVHLREPIDEHEAIVTAMASGSAKAARKAMRNHICRAAGRGGVQLEIPGA